MGFHGRHGDSWGFMGIKVQSVRWFFFQQYFLIRVGFPGFSSTFSRDGFGASDRQFFDDDIVTKSSWWPSLLGWKIRAIIYQKRLMIDDDCAMRRLLHLLRWSLYILCWSKSGNGESAMCRCPQKLVPARFFKAKVLALHSSRALYHRNRTWPSVWKFEHNSPVPNFFTHYRMF